RGPSGGAEQRVEYCHRVVEGGIGARELAVGTPPVVEDSIAGPDGHLAGSRGIPDDAKPRSQPVLPGIDDGSPVRKVLSCLEYTVQKVLCAWNNRSIGIEGG